MLRQVELRILTALPDLFAIVGIPRTALLDNVFIGSEIQHITLNGNSLSEHDIKVRLFERRGHFILHNLDAGVISDNFPALFQRLHSSDIKPDRRIELECSAAGCRFRIAKHDTDFFTELVDEDHGAVCFADGRRQFAARLRHHAGLQPHVGISHIAVDLRLGNQRGN